MRKKAEELLNYVRKDGSLCDMANTPTTPASFASRLTDDEIDRLAQSADDEFDYRAAAVLRDYVRLRIENAKLKERLEAVMMECEREISFRQKTATRCEMCMEDSSAGEDCPYHGEPNGCNSPTYGEFPSEKECEPFDAIIRVARGEGGAE